MSLVQAAPGYSAPVPEPAVTGADFLYTLRRHIGRILIITAMFAMGSVLYVVLAVPRFAVSGSLYLGDAQNHGQTAPAGYDGLGVPTSFQTVSDVDTQIDLLNSPSLIEQAILETGLNAPVHAAADAPPDYARWLLFESRKVQAFAPGPGDVRAQYATLDQPNAAAQKFRIVMGQGGTYEIDRCCVLSGGVVLRGRLSVPEAGGGLNLLLSPAIAGAPPPAGAVFALEVTPAQVLATQMIDSGALVIAAGGSQVNPTNVASLTLTSQAPYAARLFIDQMMNDFIGAQLAWKTKSASDTEDYIQQQLVTVRQSLADADEKLAVYQAQTGILDVPANAQAIIGQLSQYEIQRTNAALQRDALQKLQAAIAGPPSGLNPYLVSQINDTVLVQLATSLATAQVQMEALNVQYTGSTLEVQSQQATIDKLEDSIKTLVGNDLSLASANVAKMDSMIAQYNEQLKSMPQESLQVIALTRSSQVYGQLYTLLMQKAEEADLSKASTVIETRIASLAQVPLVPATPRPLVTILAGTIMGILAGCSFAFGNRAASGRLQSEAEAVRLTRLPVYGLLPAHRRRPAADGVFLERSQDPFTESMRFVRDNIYQTHPAREGCVLLITSATSGDGKTEVALNLARSLADDGRKTILVDADLRRSMENKIFRSAADGHTDPLLAIANMAVQNATATGLSDWVATARPPLFEKYPKQEFYMLPAGPLPLNPVELMNRDRFAQALAALRQEFEFVVIDSPPLPAVADGLPIAKQADIVLSVVRPCHTGRQALVTHNELLGRLGRGRGLIVNDVTGAGYGYGYGDGLESQFRPGGAKTDRLRRWAKALWHAASK